MTKEKADTAAVDQELDAVKAVLKALVGLSAEGKQWVLKTVSDRLGLQPPAGAGAPAPASPGGATPPAGTTSIGSMTAKEFLAAKRPLTDVERVACLAYYLTHAMSKPHFKTSDITDANTKAAGGPFSNAARSVNNATHQSSFLAPAGKGNKQMTPHGEDVVKALPNREKVKELLAAQAPVQRRRRKKGKKRAKP